MDKILLLFFVSKKVFLGQFCRFGLVGFVWFVGFDLEGFLLHILSILHTLHILHFLHLLNLMHILRIMHMLHILHISHHMHQDRIRNQLSFKKVVS